MAQIRITPEELRNASDFLMQRLDAINNEVASLIPAEFLHPVKHIICCMQKIPAAVSLARDSPTDSLRNRHYRKCLGKPVFHF